MRKKKKGSGISHSFRQLKTTVSISSAKAEGSVTFILEKGAWMNGWARRVHDFSSKDMSGWFTLLTNITGNTKAKQKVN